MIDTDYVKKFGIKDGDQVGDKFLILVCSTMIAIVRIRFLKLLIGWLKCTFRTLLHSSCEFLDLFRRNLYAR